MARVILVALYSHVVISMMENIDFILSRFIWAVSSGLELQDNFV